MIKRQTIFECDGCGETNEQSSPAPNRPMVPNGWYLVKVTEDETRYFVKLACARCFVRMSEVFKQKWGMPASDANEARG